LRRRGRARGLGRLSLERLGVRRRWVVLGGEARGTGVGRARREAGGEEGRDRGRHAGWSEGDSAGDLLQGGGRRRLREKLGQGKGGGREAGGRHGGPGDGDRHDEAAAVAVVAQAFGTELEDPSRLPPLEFGLLRDLLGRDRDEADGRVFQQPVVGRLLLLLLLLLGLLLLLRSRVLGLLLLLLLLGLPTAGARLLG
jgi:hypothetical protein